MGKATKITTASILTGALLLGSSAPANAIRGEEIKDNGNAVISLNQTDQTALVSGGVFAASSILGLLTAGWVGGLSASTLGPYVQNAGKCPGDEALYLEADPNGVIQKGWCE